MFETKYTCKFWLSDRLIIIIIIIIIVIIIKIIMRPDLEIFKENKQENTTIVC